MAKKTVIKIPGKKGVREAEGVVVWARVGARKHKFFIVDQGFVSRPVLTDWASGYSVVLLPEKGIFYGKTLKQRVEVAIVELIERTIVQVEREARKNRTPMTSQAIYDAALTRIYKILDDVTVINGKMTKHHKAQLAANTLKAVEKIKTMRPDVVRREVLKCGAHMYACPEDKSEPFLMAVLDGPGPIEERAKEIWDATKDKYTQKLSHYTIINAYAAKAGEIKPKRKRKAKI